MNCFIAYVAEEQTPELAADSIPVKPLSATDNHLLENQADGSHLLEEIANGVPSSEFSKSQIDVARQFDSALMPGPVILKENADKLAETEVVKDTDSAVMPEPEIPAEETAGKVAETGVAEHIDSAIMPGPEVPAKETEENTAETEMAKDTDSAIMPGSEVPAKETAENTAETEVAKQFDSALMPGPEILDKNTAETRSESETGGSVVDNEVSKNQIDMAKQFNSVLMPGPVLPDGETAEKLIGSEIPGNAVGSVVSVNSLNETNVGDVLPASSVSSGMLPNVQNIPKETAGQYTETGKASEIEKQNMYEAMPEVEKNYPQSVTGQENGAINNPIPDQRTSQDDVNGKVSETLSQGPAMLNPNAVKNEVNTDTGDLSSNQINNDLQREAFPAQGREQMIEPKMVNTISNAETGVLDSNKIRGEGDPVGSLSDKENVPIQPGNLVPDTNANIPVPLPGNMISNADKKMEQGDDNIDSDAVLPGPAGINQDVKVTLSTTTAASNIEMDEFESTEINKYVDDNDAGDIKEADYDYDGDDDDYDDDDDYEDEDDNNFFDNDDTADDEDVFGDVGNDNENNDLFDSDKDDDNNLNNFLNDFDDGKENNETYNDFVDGSITSTTTSTTRDYILDAIDSEDDEKDDDPFQWRDRLKEPFDGGK